VIRSHHARVFHELMIEHRKQMVDAIINGGIDYPMYRQIVGSIQGIDDALRISEQADINISGGQNAA
jgi:hypothetical protein